MKDCQTMTAAPINVDWVENHLFNVHLSETITEKRLTNNWLTSPLKKDQPATGFPSESWWRHFGTAPALVGDCNSQLL